MNAYASPQRREAAESPLLASRRPQKLTELLYQVGLVPADAVLTDLFEVSKMVAVTVQHEPVAAGSRGTKFRVPNTLSERKDRSLERALEICLKDHPDLAAYIAARQRDEDRPAGAPWYWYVFIREAREKLRRLAAGEPVSSVGGPITIGKDWLFEAHRDQFAEAIDGLDSRYLKICALNDCKRVFLAKRINQPYCSKKHGNVARNRILRAKRAEGDYQGARLTEKEKKEAVKKKRAKTARKRLN